MELMRVRHRRNGTVHLAVFGDTNFREPYLFCSKHIVAWGDSVHSTQLEWQVDWQSVSAFTPITCKRCRRHHQIEHEAEESQIVEACLDALDVWLRSEENRDRLIHEAQRRKATAAEVLGHMLDDALYVYADEKDADIAETWEV